MGMLLKAAHRMNQAAKNAKDARKIHRILLNSLAILAHLAVQIVRPFCARLCLFVAIVVSLCCLGDLLFGMKRSEEKWSRPANCFTSEKQERIARQSQLAV